MGVRDNDCGQVWTSDTGGVFKAKNFSKEGYLSFRYRSPCEGWLYLPPLPTRIQR
jgi:hypothetical protein